MGFYACCSFDNNSTALNLNLYKNLDGAGFSVEDGLSTNSNPASLTTIPQTLQCISRRVI